MIMSKLSCLVLLLTVLCTLAAAAPKNEIKDNVVLQHEKPGNGELKESKLMTKCYDEETKSFYKVDSIWYPEGKCEERNCFRTGNSKTPIIKAMECKPCTSCSLPNQTCQPLKAEKNYPKCCPQCLTKAEILKKTTKKY